MNRSTTVGMPNARTPPPGFGISARFTGCGRYVPPSNSSFRRGHASLRYADSSFVVIPSTPGLPLFDRTRFSARRRFAASTTSSMTVCAKAPARFGAAPGGDPPLGSGRASPASSQSKASCTARSRAASLVGCLIPARASPWCLVAGCSALPRVAPGTMASADCCHALPTRCRPGSQTPGSATALPG